MNVTIVDYKSGTISSVINSFKEVAEGKIKIEVTSELNKIKLSDKLVLPGQGSFKSCTNALTNISDSQEIFCLSGHYVRDLLSKGCPIDLHINSFNKGMSAQTILEKVDVLLFCNDKNSISITFKRSYYDYVSSWIKDAATEFGYKFSD